MQRWFSRGERGKFISNYFGGRIIIPVSGIQIRSPGLYEFEVTEKRENCDLVRVVAGPIATVARFVGSISPEEEHADIIIRKYDYLGGLNNSAYRNTHLLAWTSQASYDAWEEKYINAPGRKREAERLALHEKVQEAAAALSQKMPPLEIKYSEMYDTWSVRGPGVRHVNMKNEEALAVMRSLASG